MRSNRRSNCFRVILLAVVLSTAINARGQPSHPTPSPSPTPSKAPTLESQFLKNVLRDQKAIWTAPLHLQSNDAKWAVPLGLGTAALIATDRRTGDEIAELDKSLNASRIVSYAGSTYTLGAVAGSFYLVGRVKNNDRARETGILSAQALVDSAIVVTALKGVTQRVRPRGGEDRSEFFEGGTSFPSGHSIQVWSVATVIANEYHNNVAVQIAAYGIASAVSISRFTGRNHYLSDVLVGSALGYGIGKYVYHAHHRKTSASGGDDGEEARGSPRRWPLIVPQYNRSARAYGVGLSWEF